MKKIIITLKPQGLEHVPEHLKQPDLMDIQVEGMNQLEVMRVVNSVLANLIVQFSNAVEQQQNQIQNKGIN